MHAAEDLDFSVALAGGGAVSSPDEAPCTSPKNRCGSSCLPLRGRRTATERTEQLSIASIAGEGLVHVSGLTRQVHE